MQEDDVTFYLYTRNQWELQITLKNLNAIDATKELRFLVHGWNATHNVMWVNELTVVSLQAEDLDIICVDWSPLASQSAFVALAHADQAGNAREILVSKHVRILFVLQRILWRILLNIW